MNKFKTTIKTILTVIMKLLGLLFCVVAISFVTDKDNVTALFSLIIGAAFYFLPDIIKKKNEEI